MTNVEKRKLNLKRKRKSRNNYTHRPNLSQPRHESSTLLISPQRRNPSTSLTPPDLIYSGMNSQNWNLPSSSRTLRNELNSSFPSLPPPYPLFENQAGERFAQIDRERAAAVVSKFDSVAQQPARTCGCGSVIWCNRLARKEGRVSNRYLFIGPKHERFLATGLASRDVALLLLFQIAIDSSTRVAPFLLLFFFFFW